MNSMNPWIRAHDLRVRIVATDWAASGSFYVDIVLWWYATNNSNKIYGLSKSTANLRHFPRKENEIQSLHIIRIINIALYHTHYLTATAIDLTVT